MESDRLSHALAYIKRPEVLAQMAQKDKEQRKAVSSKRCAYVKQRTATDPEFAWMLRIRGATRSIFRAKRLSKIARLQAIIGCSPEALKTHLIGLFTEGMSEELLMTGKIHIDHIRPVASFNLKDEKQVLECFNFKNLQPLWPKDNWSKSSKWNGHTYAKNVLNTKAILESLHV